jgi:SulP family sulfate permease
MRQECATIKTQTEAQGHRYPVLEGILPLNRSHVPADMIAGSTLAALAIPEVMGYTKIAGTPVVTGLYTILLPMALFALFGSSRHLIVGADSATAAILAAGLAGIATAGSPAYVALAGALALMAAALLIIARLIGLGFLADFLSRTVLVGFLTGVGIQVGIGQLAGMLGVPQGGSGAVHQLTAVATHLFATHLPTLAVSIAVLVLIVGARTIAEKIPGALIAVIGAIIASWALHLSAHGVAVLGPVPSGLPTLGLPDVTWGHVPQLLPTAASIFVVILAQSAATSRTYAARYHERLSEDVDLVGLSLANIGAGLSGTFVVNGSPTKTQMVDSAGGRSQVAPLTTSIIVLLVLLFLTAPLAYLPSAVLAAVVFLIGIELVDIAGMRTIFVQRRDEFVVALITAAVVVFVGVEQGILLAMALSLLDHVRRGYKPKNAVLVADAQHGWRTVPVTSPAQVLPGLIVYRFAASLYYANAHRFSAEVIDLVTEADPPLSWFCVDAAAIADVDFSGAATVRETSAALHERGVRLVFTEVSSDVRVEFNRYELTATLGTDAFYDAVTDVVTTYRQRGATAAAPP